MNTKFDIQKSCGCAVKLFWETKSQQLKNSSDSSNNRGAVVGGKQMDGFIELLKSACISVGVPASCIYDRNNYIPGFFRSSKDWDFIVISPNGRLLVAIELKSQIGSYGNNFNNRTEEALGTAIDLWTAFREKQFVSHGTPWIGFLMLIGHDKGSTTPVRNYANHYPVRPEFDNTSYLDRYRIFCEKLITEHLYTSTCLLWTKDSSSFGNVSIDISIDRFINSLQGYLIGCKDEFDR